MSCLFTSINYSSLSSFNACKYNAAGIKKVWIASYDSSTKNNVNISNQMVNSITLVPLQWFELHLSRTNTKPSETLLSNGNYEQTFEFSIGRMQPNRRLTINSLVKGKWFIIVQDMNQYFWFLGLQNGMVTKSYSATTDVYLGGNGYTFVMKTEQVDNLIGVNENYINSNVDIALDCSIFYNIPIDDLDYYIWEMEDCIIGDFPT